MSRDMPITAEPASMGKMTITIAKLGLRQRVGRWLLGEKQVEISSALAAQIHAKNAEVEKNRADLTGTHFQIIGAVNGKIIRYAARDERAMRIGHEDSYYVVKEGEDLLGAIAACLALDRIK